jgi:hypothetical protein
VIQQGEFPWMVRNHWYINFVQKIIPSRYALKFVVILVIQQKDCVVEHWFILNGYWLTAAHCMLDNERKTRFPADDAITYIDERT